MSLRSVRVFSAPTLALAFALANLIAQQPRVLAPHKPVAPLFPRSKAKLDPFVSQHATGGLWMIDATTKSSMYLQNQLKTDSLTVTPILYLSNGTKYTLPQITLEPSGIAIVHLNDQLAQKGIAPWAPLYGFAEIEYKAPWAVVTAYVRILDTAHSLVFPYSLRNPPIDSATTANVNPQHVLEGMWWKQEPDVTAFVALSNVTGAPIKATVEATDAENVVLSTHEITVSPHGTKMLQLTELNATSDAGGGVQVAYAGPEDGLAINAALEDEAVGYSANLPIGPPPKPQTKPSSTSYAEIGLMAGAADPMMSFPSGTTFTPYSVVRNISDQPYTIKPTLWWMAAGSPDSASFPAITVLPHHTHTIDFASLLSHVGERKYNGSLNLVLDVQGPPLGLAMASGSVDKANTYVFEVVPRAVLESVSKSLAHWSTADGDDTMITLWNPADEAQDFVFTLFFPGGQYKWPLHMGPRATEMFNTSEIIHNQIPDVDGNTIPVGVHDGTAEIAGSRGENEHILIVMDAGTYNLQKATCVCEWVTCNGLTGLSVIATPWAVRTGATNQLTFTVKYNTGNQYNVTSQSSWTSSKTSVATVQTGLITGVSPGAATMTGHDQNFESVYVSNLCGQPPLPSCPVSQVQPSGSSGGGVLQITSVAPSNLTLGGSGVLTISGQGFQTLTSPSAQFGAGSGITTGTPTVVSDMQMTVSYQVTCSALVGGQTLQIGNSGDGGVSGPTWSESVVLPSAPAPTIKLNGNSISGTQSVVVGQQIALSASVAVPACTSVSSPQWTPTSSATTGTPVGGYAASTASGSVSPLPPNTNSTYTFYWAYPASSAQATYRYTLSGGGSSAPSSVATATFNVTGPTGGTMSSTAINKLYIANLSSCATRSGGPYLIYAQNATGTACSYSASPPGITFNSPTGYSNTSGGSFFLGQLVSYDNLTGGGTTYGPGLDTVWPGYGGTAPPHNDNPNIYLASTYRNLTRSFESTIFLMWQSSTANSIPVPLGYQTYQFSATATCSASCGTASNWTVSSSTAGLESGFIASSPSQSSVKQNTLTYGFPTWTSVSF